MSTNMFGYAAGASFQNPHVWAFNKAQMYAGAPSAQVVDFDGAAGRLHAPPGERAAADGHAAAGHARVLRLDRAVPERADRLQVPRRLGQDLDVDVHRARRPDSRRPAGRPRPRRTRRPRPTPPTCSRSGRWRRPSTRTSAAPSRCGCRTPCIAARRHASAARPRSATPRRAGTRSTSPAAPSRPTTSRPRPGTRTARTRSSASCRALAVDRVGDMAIGYTTSNATTNPPINYAGRLASDPVNTFSQGEQTLIDGTGSQSGNCGPSTCVRWGDYSAMALDPNGCTFWETDEYYATTGLNHQTRIGSFHFPGCTTVGNGTLSGTVTDGTNPISGATVALGSRTTTTNGSGVYSFTVPAGTYPTESAAKAGFGPASATTPRRARRRHADAELHAQRRGPERLLHGQLAEHVPARRPERVRPRSRARATSSSGERPGQPAEHDGHEQRLRRQHDVVGRADVHPVGHRPADRRSTSTSSAPAAPARRRTSRCRSARPRPPQCRPAPTSPPRRSPASTAARAASSRRTSPARRR